MDAQGSRVKSFIWVQLFILTWIESIHINNNSACRNIYVLDPAEDIQLEVEERRLVELHFYAKIVNYRRSRPSEKQSPRSFSWKAPCASSSLGVFPSPSLFLVLCPSSPSHLSPFGMMHICSPCHIFATLPSSILSVVCPFLSSPLTTHHHHHHPPPPDAPSLPPSSSRSLDDFK